MSVCGVHFNLWCSTFAWVIAYAFVLSFSARGFWRVCVCVCWCRVCGMTIMRCIARWLALDCPCCLLPYSVCVSVCVCVWWSMYMTYAMRRSGDSLVQSPVCYLPACQHPAPPANIPPIPPKDMHARHKVVGVWRCADAQTCLHSQSLWTHRHAFTDNHFGRCESARCCSPLQFFAPDTKPWR